MLLICQWHLGLGEVDGGGTEGPKNEGDDNDLKTKERMDCQCWMLPERIIYLWAMDSHAKQSWRTSKLGARSSDHGTQPGLQESTVPPPRGLLCNDWGLSSRFIRKAWEFGHQPQDMKLWIKVPGPYSELDPTLEVRRAASRAGCPWRCRWWLWWWMTVNLQLVRRVFGRPTAASSMWRYTTIAIIFHLSCESEWPHIGLPTVILNRLYQTMVSYSSIVIHIPSNIFQN